MNILVTVNTFYPKLDGVQAVTDYLAKGLIAKGHKLTVVTPLEDGLSKEEIYNGIKIIRVEIHTKFCLYRGNKKEYRKLIINLANKSDVMINVCTQNALTDLLFPVLDQIHCKKILHVHGINKFKWDRNDISDFKHFAYKLWKNFKWGSLYLLNCSSMKKYDAVLQLHKFDSGYISFEKWYGIKSYILENACDSRFADLESCNKGKMFVSVANYTARKNQEFLIRAFYESMVPDEWRLILIGGEKNKYYEKLVKLCLNLEKQFGHRNIELLFGISREKTIDIVKNSSVYLLGSKWEAFSISIIEAMAAKVPFISTNTGVTKFMPGGVVVDSITEMSYWIETFIRNEDIRISYGKLGNKYYKTYLTTENKIQSLEKLLYELVNN